MKKIMQLSLLSVALLSQLQAQEIILKPLAVTSTAITTDELTSSDAVEVYTQEDIQKAHVRNLYEFLNQQTSLYTTSGYGNPFLQKIDMRGFGVGNGYQNIVITINGRKMNNIDMVPQLLSSIAPSSIKKIEIIKSSGIVVGGDGANAGTINITTRKSNAKEVSFYLGNYGLADGSFYYGARSKILSVTASGETQKSDGIRTINAARQKDSNRFSTGGFNLSYTPDEALEFRLGARSTRTDVIYAGSLTKAEYDADIMQAGASNYGATQQKYDSDVLSAGVKYDINQKLSFSAQLSNEQKKSNYVTYTSVTNYDYNSLKASLDYETDDYALKAGIDGFDGKLSRTNLDLSKTNKALFLMSEFYLDSLTLKAGYRYETVEFKKARGEDTSDALNGIELGINYLLNKNSSLYLNYSHSYESASLDRLFSFFTGDYKGYVAPSKANNFTLGYNNIQRKNKLKLSAYYVSLKDEIYYYADPTYVNSKNTNIDASHKYGLDLYEKYIFSKKFNALLNYNYVEAIIDQEKQNGDDYAGKKLPGVSNHNLKLTLTYTPNKQTTLSLIQVYRSEAYSANDFNNNFTQKQDPYSTTNLSYTYAKDNYEFFAKINNLFNEKNGLWIRDDAIYPISFTRTALAGLKLKY